MKRSLALLAVFALFLSTSAGLAGELPESPEMGFVQRSVPVTQLNRPPLLKRVPWVDGSLYSGVIATHAGDWASTEQCLRNSQRQEKAGFAGLCQEALLPTALVDSKAGLGAYEAATAGLEIYSQYVLTKHRHRRLARNRPIGQYRWNRVRGSTQLSCYPKRRHIHKKQPCAAGR